MREDGLHIVDYCSSSLKICDVHLKKIKHVETCRSQYRTSNMNIVLTMF